MGAVASEVVAELGVVVLAVVIHSILFVVL
jgi:hypothetical protein